MVCIFDLFDLDVRNDKQESSQSKDDDTNRKSLQRV